MRRILIVGYPYIRENYFKTFDSYPKVDSIFFVLPKIWKAKKGKLNFIPPVRKNVYTTNAYFYHSDYSFFGGVLKGWMPSFPSILIKLRKKIDIVYSPSEPILLTTLYQAFWSKLLGKKHVIFTWENVAYESKFHGLNLLLKKIILRLNLSFSDGVICGNRKSQDLFKKYTHKPTAIIPLSGVDTNFYVRDEELARDKFVYTFAGAVGYRKGIHLVVEALRTISKEVPNAHLNIVGTGEYEEKLKQLVASHNLQDHITFTSWADKDGLKKILSLTDVFLYPSLSFGGWEEQFGYSMAEASLMGLPIVATKSGSIDEVVIDGETGILVAPDKSEELSLAMLKLARDSELRKRLGENGRKYIVDNFAYSVVANKFYNFFEQIKL